MLLEANLHRAILLRIIICDFTAHSAHIVKIVHNFHDIKLSVATIVVGFYNMFQKPTTFFMLDTTITSKF